MSKPLDELYYEWLYSQVCSPKTLSPSRTYYKLTDVLFTTRFEWFVPNDDNRADEGRELRFEFLDAFQIDENDPFWISLDCSIFEVLIALSRTLAFELGGTAREWFWEMLGNLELDQFTDSNWFESASKEEVDYILRRLMDRTYDPDGKGGLFPLKNPGGDQRAIEIWYQLNAYAAEQF